MHLLYALLPLLTTISALKVIGQYRCDKQPTNNYLCFNQQNYAICKTNTGWTNIYEVPEGKDWCVKAVATGMKDNFNAIVSTAFDGKWTSTTTKISTVFTTPATTPLVMTKAGEGGMAAAASAAI